MKHAYRMSRVVNGTVLEIKELKDATKKFAIDASRAWANSLSHRAAKSTLILLESRKRGWPLEEWQPVNGFRRLDSGRVVTA